MAILRAAFLIVAFSMLCGCTITTDGAFFTGTSIGIGDSHYAPSTDQPDDICCWRHGSGRWF